MPDVKICGVTRLADALAAAEAGAVAVGLNFWPGGPRCVTPHVAREIAAALPSRVQKVGVFVNAEREDMVRIAETVGLDVIQLHGDEGPGALADLPCPVWKAFRGAVTDADLDAFSAADGFVLDGAKAGFYGGSGTLADTASGALVRTRGFFVLAGGLTPANVAQRIALARPDMVDTASGVEMAPGIKDPALMRAFVAASKGAESGAA